MDSKFCSGVARASDSLTVTLNLVLIKNNHVFM